MSICVIAPLLALPDTVRDHSAINRRPANWRIYRPVLAFASRVCFSRLLLAFV